MEDNGDDAGSKLSRKGNVGAGVRAKRDIHDITGLENQGQMVDFSPAKKGRDVPFQ